MLTLDAFLSKTSHTRNAYVTFPGMKSLYVRVGPYRVNTEVMSTIQIANVEASEPGSGAFSRLVDHLVYGYPDLTIVVENVHSDILAAILDRMEFERINVETGRHFAKLGDVGDPGPDPCGPDPSAIVTSPVTDDDRERFSGQNRAFDGSSQAERGVW